MIIHKKHIHLVRTTIVEFFQDLPLMHSAALAYYTLLAMVPLIYMSIMLFGKIIGQEQMLDVIGYVLTKEVGIQDVSSIMSFLSDVDFTKSSPMLQVLGTIAILFSTTAILNSLRISINQFYGVERKKIGAKRIILRTLLARLISMAFVIGFAVLIIVIYFAETIFLSIGENYLEEKQMMHWFLSAITRHGLPILTNLIIFAFVFKYLHDGVVRWGIAMRGATATSIMLYVGQLLIKYYLLNYFFASGAGVAGTFLVLIVWVYYSAFILFFGVKMTATYAKLIGEPIQFRD